MGGRWVNGGMKTLSLLIRLPLLVSEKCFLLLGVKTNTAGCFLQTWTLAPCKPLSPTVLLTHRQPLQDPQTLLSGVDIKRECREAMPRDVDVSSACSILGDPWCRVEDLTPDYHCHSRGGSVGSGAARGLCVGRASSWGPLVVSVGTPCVCVPLVWEWPVDGQ